MKKLTFLIILLLSYYGFSNDYLYVERYRPYSRESTYFEEFFFYDDGLIKQINRYSIKDGIDFYNWNSDKKKLTLLESFLIERTNSEIIEYHLKGDVRETIKRFKKMSASTWERVRIEDNEEDKDIIELTEEDSTNIHNSHLKLGDNCYLVNNTLQRMFNYSVKMEYTVEFDNKNVYTIKTNYPYGEEDSITCFVSGNIPFTKESAFINFYLIASSNAFDTVFFSVPTIPKAETTYHNGNSTFYYSEDKFMLDKTTINIQNKQNYYGVEYYYDTNNNKYLVLKSEDCLLFYNKEQTPPIFCGLSNQKNIIGHYSINASSFLKEETISYLPYNLVNIKLKEPWVEGKNGDGEGEFITINKGDASGMYLVNGFISLDRPDLYEKNNRIERFEIEGLSSKNKSDELLLDTSKPQYFDLSMFSKDKEIRITIKSVYKGTLYEDTCLAGVILIK